MTGGPFIGPRGGKWADAKHTIPWREMKPGSHVEPQGGAKVSPRLAAHRKQLRIGGEYKTSWGYVAVLPDPSAPGKVRTQSFDEQGFSGHQTYADLDALAADTVPHKGKWQPTPGILDKLSTTDQWAEGMARARTVQALNTLGYHRQRDDVERINRHVERHGFRSAADALSGWGEDDTELSPQTRARLAKASPRLVVKSQRARPTPPSGLTDGPLDYHLSWWGPRLIIKASVRLKRKVHPAQAGLFGDAPAARKQPMLFGRKPPGGGWQIIPGGKKGGYRRRRGKGWEYWY
ncbi:MAG: hypothetical protein KJN79_00215, partial [Gammaproteobacteria bacterium]|nr:hypothetical protein [Gammaproteobacteria bacterium]